MKFYPISRLDIRHLLILILVVIGWLVGQQILFYKDHDLSFGYQALPNILIIKEEWQGLTANEVIGKYKKGAIRQQFPRQFLDKPIESIEKATQAGDKSAQTAMKLLKDNRFNKDDNRK